MKIFSRVPGGWPTLPLATSLFAYPILLSFLPIANSPLTGMVTLGFAAIAICFQSIRVPGKSMVAGVCAAYSVYLIAIFVGIAPSLDSIFRGRCSVAGIYYVRNQLCSPDGRTSGLAEVFQQGDRIMFRNECAQTVLGFMNNDRSIDVDEHAVWGPIKGTVDRNCNIITWTSGSIWIRQIGSR
jgi:hypothetical protein